MGLCRAYRGAGGGDRHGQRLVNDLTDPHALGAVGLQAGDYELAGFDDADVVIAVSYDFVRARVLALEPHAPQDDRVRRCDTGEIDQPFVPTIKLIGDISRSLDQLAQTCGPVSHPGGSRRLRDTVLARFEHAATEPGRPLQPPRVLYELGRALRPNDVLISDVGLHKL